VSARTLHPAARRRLLPQGEPDAPHDVLLRAWGGEGSAALIVTAAEDSFLDAVLEDAVAPDARARLAARRDRRRGADRVLELHQPVHRRFQLILLEACCEMPGRPRLDPAKIESMGFVLRRREGSAWQGWTVTSPRGWVHVPPDLDPDPVRRTPPRPGAAVAIAAEIALRRGGPPPAEQVLSLFLAPPDVCVKAGCTLLYGVIPVASAERSEMPEPGPDYAGLPAGEAADLRAHLSSFLKSRPRVDLPRPGQLLSPAWNPLAIAPDAGGTDGLLRSFGVFLHQLLVELDAFGTGTAAALLRAALAEIVLPLERDAFGRVTRSTTAAAFCAAAAPVLIGGDANATGLRMPLEWPAVDSQLGARLTEAAIACLGQRHAAILPPAPKFDGEARLYAVRPFIRVRGHADCPARLVWGQASEPFRILPWWESDGPAARISLPDVAALKKVKPNVAFDLPPELANLLQGDMTKLKDGEGSTAGLALGWICSFSIPIITLCAFIVLNIFLSLFDLIFRWLAFIKICLPVPRRR
jgi:hypothetical protein